MACQKEDYQLLLNNIVQLLKIDWKLAVVLMEGQNITVNDIPFEEIVEDVITGEFIVNGLTVISCDEKYITIQGSTTFNGRNFDKTLPSFPGRASWGWSKTYLIHDFKYRMTNYLYQNLKNTMDESVK